MNCITASLQATSAINLTDYSKLFYHHLVLGLAGRSNDLRRRSERVQAASRSFSTMVADLFAECALNLGPTVPKPLT